MSKDDKKAEFTPADNVAANDVATEEAPVKRRLPLSKGAIIGLSAAGVAVILGAGFTGAAIADAFDHKGGRPGEHSQFDGGRGGDRDGHNGSQGQFGPQGQGGQQLPGQPMPGQVGPNGQFVDPDPNDNDGPGTGIAPKGAPQGVAPTAPATPKA
jgi:hypothetical protein